MKQLTLPFHLPGADWQEHEPYKSERGKTAPALIMVGGVVYEYVTGSLLNGCAEYRETNQ
jgi:hypothetical protein